MDGQRTTAGQAAPAGGKRGRAAQAPDARDTRALLIDVAERLFAELGIGAVSLRTVGIQAGQRNNSAAQYHFGSKEGLITAIIEDRSRAIDARRAELIGRLRESGEPVTLRALVNLLVLPLAEAATASDEPTWYLRFLANVVEQPVLEALTGTDGSRPEPPALRYTRRELRRLLPGLPEEEFERRLRWQAMITLRILADHERHRWAAGSAGGASPVSTAQVVSDLNTTLAALLQAPYPAV